MNRLDANETAVFASITGDYPNIGDAFIRRQALGWVREFGVGTIYAKRAPASWIDSVGVRPSDQVITKSRLRWLWLIIRSRKIPVVIYEPGEIDLDRPALVREVLFTVVALIARLKGGVVILPPRAVVKTFWPTVWVHRLNCAISSSAFWRDAKSLSIVRRGHLTPDIGFWGDERAGVEPKRYLGVSLRGRRAIVSLEWIAAVREWARLQDLTLMTFAQVQEDEDRALEVSELLGCEHLAWTSGYTEHEERLRAMYDRCAFVISDRLHVLIVSSLSGAVPVELVGSPSGKVSTHFQTIGYENLSFDSSEQTASAIIEFLSMQNGRSAEVGAAVTRAHAALDLSRRAAVSKAS